MKIPSTHNSITTKLFLLQTVYCNCKLPISENHSSRSGLGGFVVWKIFLYTLFAKNPQVLPPPPPEWWNQYIADGRGSNLFGHMLMKTAWMKKMDRGCASLRPPSTFASAALPSLPHFFAAPFPTPTSNPTSICRSLFRIRITETITKMSKRRKDFKGDEREQRRVARDCII